MNIINKKYQQKNMIMAFGGKYPVISKIEFDIKFGKNDILNVQGKVYLKS